MKLSEITTPRLRLRLFTLDDADDVQLLAGHRAVAYTTAAIPHPYRRHHAVDWICKLEGSGEESGCYNYAVVLRNSDRLIGTVGLTVEADHRCAELGYWFGFPFWNKGYCTEAAHALLCYAFGQLQFKRISANHLLRNPASGKVLMRLGMSLECIQRESLCKWGVFEDMAYYSIRCEEFVLDRSLLLSQH